MFRWTGRIAVVTGAGAGIGAAITLDLIKAGMIVVGLGRRPERIEALRELIPEDTTGQLYSYQCDVSKEEDIVSTFQWIESTIGGVDVLVNNAGIAKSGNIVDAGNTEILTDTVNTNIMGVALCTREAFQSMKNRNVDGHVFLINSYCGHVVPFTIGTFGSFNVYQSTKHALTAMTEVLRQEFQAEYTKIKVTVSVFIVYY